jgi:hypothetical protein
MSNRFVEYATKELATFARELDLIENSEFPNGDRDVLVVVKQPSINKELTSCIF